MLSSHTCLSENKCYSQLFFLWNVCSVSEWFLFGLCDSVRCQFTPGCQLVENTAYYSHWSQQRTESQMVDSTRPIKPLDSIWETSPFIVNCARSCLSSTWQTRVSTESEEERDSFCTFPPQSVGLIQDNRSFPSHLDNKKMAWFTWIHLTTFENIYFSI